MTTHLKTGLHYLLTMCVYVCLSACLSTSVSEYMHMSTGTMEPQTVSVGSPSTGVTGS